MNYMRTVRLLSTVGVWAGLVLLLVLIRAQLTNFSPLALEWPERNAELNGMFAARDGGSDRLASLPSTGVPSALEKVAATLDGERPLAAEQAAAAHTSDTKGGGAEGTEAKGSNGNSLIDINRAIETELTKLPGIGPAKAKAIIEYREAHGSFRSPEELKKVKGIGEKTFETLKPLITIGNKG